MERAAGHGPKAWGGVWSWLGLVLGRDHGVPTHLSPMAFLTLRGHETFLQVGLIFAPHGEKLVHRNHMI